MIPVLTVGVMAASCLILSCRHDIRTSLCWTSDIVGDTHMHTHTEGSSCIFKPNYINIVHSFHFLDKKIFNKKVYLARIRHEVFCGSELYFIIVNGIQGIVIQ